MSGHDEKADLRTKGKFFSQIILLSSIEVIIPVIRFNLAFSSVLNFLFYTKS